MREKKLVEGRGSRTEGKTLVEGRVSRTEGKNWKAAGKIIKHFAPQFPQNVAGQKKLK